MVQCVLCKEPADPENPFKSGAVHTLNPYTFRRAWMCGHCLEEAAEECKSLPATKIDFENRYDEWLWKLEEE